MELRTAAHYPSPRKNKLRLTALAMAAAATIFIVTALAAATGDNIADAVLGQIDFSHNGLNNPGAGSLFTPAQLAIDLNAVNQHLYVVDAQNHRELGWNDSAAFVSGQNADLEIGQPDFQTTLCNSGKAIGDVSGLGPEGLATDAAGNLFVSDQTNNRVLEFNLPLAALNIAIGVGDTVADRVFDSHANLNRILDSYFGGDPDDYFHANPNRVFDGRFDRDSDNYFVTNADIIFDGRLDCDANSDRNANLDADRIRDRVSNEFADLNGNADRVRHGYGDHHSNCERDANVDRHCDFVDLRDAVTVADHSAYAGPIRDRDHHSDCDSHTNADADSDRDARVGWLARSISEQPEPRQRSIRREQEQQAETRRDHQHQHGAGDIHGHRRERRFFPRQQMRSNNRAKERV